MVGIPTIGWDHRESRVGASREAVVGVDWDHEVSVLESPPRLTLQERETVSHDPSNWWERGRQGYPVLFKGGGQELPGVATNHLVAMK